MGLLSLANKDKRFFDCLIRYKVPLLILDKFVTDYMSVYISKYKCNVQKLLNLLPQFGLHKIHRSALYYAKLLSDAF